MIAAAIEEHILPPDVKAGRHACRPTCDTARTVVDKGL
jgi:hypothetical protein